MRTLVATFLFALLPLASAALPGGKACQVADSAVPTPGLSELVMGSKPDQLPAQARLTATQINRLAEVDSKNRAILEGIAARVAKLPAGKGATEDATLAEDAVPEQAVAELRAPEAKDAWKQHLQSLWASEGTKR